MRKVIKGSVWFQNSEPILTLMTAQCSAVRSAYQAIHKLELTGVAVDNYVKKNYAKTLNQRYIDDAVMKASAIRFDNALFGGKKLWDDFQKGKITKTEWQERRNNQLYSRGDRSHKGNPNIRVIGDKLLVNDPAQRGKWFEGKLFISKKWRGFPTDCYDVRLMHSKGKFTVVISWNENVPKLPSVLGAIGIDTNPNGFGVSEVDKKGNLLHHEYLSNNRIQFASANKRNYDVKQMAVKVVDLALVKNKSLIVEDLKFSKKKKHKKFNRMRSNFLYSQLLEAVERRAESLGITITKVNPAFTSILGTLKYKDMYSLSKHESAALVIARRGLGLKERNTLTIKPSKKKNWLTLEGRGQFCDVSQKAYSWLQDKFLKPDTARLTALGLDSDNLSRAYVSYVGETPTSESSSITGQWGVSLECQRHSTNQGEGKAPFRNSVIN